MPQPSQMFSPWLTPSLSVVTGGAGAPASTITSIVYVTPTYYGPSIPLGTLYSYGGYSYPATVILPTAPQTTTTTTVAPSVAATTTPPSTTLFTTTATPSTFFTIPITSTSLSAPSTTTAIPSTSIFIPITSTSFSAPLTTPFTTIATSSIVPTLSFVSTLPSSFSSATITIPTTSSTSLSAPSTTPFTTIATSSTLPAPSPVATLPSPSSSVTIPITSSISLSASFMLSLSLLSSSLTSSTLTTISASSATSSSLSVPTSTVSSPPVGPVQATGWSKSNLVVAVVVASILGLIFLFVLALLLYLWCRRTRNRNRFAHFTALDDNYSIIPPGGRLPGEGSPRHSGEEADPFLQRSSSGWAAAARAATMSQAPGRLPSVPEHTECGGTDLSETEIEPIAHETVVPDDHNQHNDPEYVGASASFAGPLVPPSLITGDKPSPAFPNSRPPFVPRLPNLSHKGSLSAESVALLTARRVKAEDLEAHPGRHSPELSGRPIRGGSNGLLGGLNLPSLANIGRMNWFKNLDSSRQFIAEPECSAAPLLEKDIETGRSKPTSERTVDSFGNRTRGVGPDVSRLMSNVSARSGTSGGTVYHDAHSSLPRTPLLTPLPHALTPAEQPPLAVTEHSWQSSPHSSPPAYSDCPLASSAPDQTRSPGAAGTSFDYTPGTDILDLPTVLNRFASISSLKETTTGSSLGSTVPPFPPPGLETIRPQVGWSDPPTDMTASIGSMAMLSGLNDRADFGFDVLEEAPLGAEQRWRTMFSGSGGFINPGSRGTFALFVDGPGFISEQGSLHSMRSHFSAYMHGSTGSAPSLRRDIGSVNSNSSRPSAYSQASGHSVAQSLAQTGSISSDKRRRGSPALSAFGHQTRAGVASSASRLYMPSPFGLYPELVPSCSSSPPVIGSPPSAHMSPDKANVIRSVGSGSMTLTADTSFGSTEGVQC